MAERLKESLLEDYDVDFICGPDEYRTLPDLVTAAVSADQRGANVQLSLEETYADIQPVRLVEGNVHAFVAISRGCNQHCAFCVVSESLRLMKQTLSSSSSYLSHMSLCGC